MEPYYFQIMKPGTNAWDQNEPFVQKFTDRQSAVAAAYLLSLVLGEQIRFTDNPYYKSNSGAYILHEEVAKAAEKKHEV